MICRISFNITMLQGAEFKNSSMERRSSLVLKVELVPPVTGKTVDILKALTSTIGSFSSLVVEILASFIP